MEADYYKIHVGQMPERVYKFFSVNHNLIDSLRENYLWLSKPSDFNDPFDCSKNLLTFRTTEKAIKELLTEHKMHANRRERRKEISYYQKKPDLIKKAFDLVFEEIIDKQGICCFSKNFSNILMWSHYSNKHTGLCLGFEPRKSLETFLLLNVKYSKVFKPTDYFNDKSAALLNMLITKHIDWQYEEEMRTFMDHSGKLPFPKSSLREVIFGCKITDENKRRIIDLIQQTGYEHVIFRQAIITKDRFKQDFTEIPV